MLCMHCMRCRHAGESTYEEVNNVCLQCLRLLHTLWTFEGPQVWDLRRYIRCAFEEYGVRAVELMYWTFEEVESAMRIAPPQPSYSREPAKLPPPHHRL